MAKLKRHEPLADGLDRLVQKEVDIILATPPVDGTRIHTVRVSAKKLRAYLRLLKKPLGKAAFQEADAVFHDMVRPLRIYRDIEVADETLTSLVDQKGKGFTTEDADSLREGLRGREPWAGREEALATLHNDLNAERVSLDLAALTVKWRDIAEALKRTYRRNKNAFANAARRPSSSNLHEWRKQAKRLGYQLEAVGRMGSKTIARLEGNLDRLTETLGRIHDLAMLKERLTVNASETHRAVKRARAAIRRQSRELRRNALAIGEAIYVKSADDFITGLNRHWSNWHGKPHKPAFHPHHLIAVKANDETAVHDL